jgi:hypothetical protein
MGFMVRLRGAWARVFRPRIWTIVAAAVSVAVLVTVLGLVLKPQAAETPLSNERAVRALTGALGGVGEYGRPAEVAIPAAPPSNPPAPPAKSPPPRLAGPIGSLSLRCAEIPDVPEGQEICTVRSVGGFAGQVSFSCRQGPPWITCAFDKPTIALSSDESKEVELTLMSTLRAPDGQYEIHVVASGGSVTATHVSSWSIGPIPGTLTGKGTFYLTCPFRSSVPVGTQIELVCSLRSHGFQGPATFSCVQDDEVGSCTPATQVVHLYRDETTTMSFTIAIPSGTHPAEYGFLVRHSGDTSPGQHPVPFSLVVRATPEAGTPGSWIPESLL